MSLRGGGEEGYYRQLFGFFDTETAKWSDLEDLTGNAAASMSSGSIAKLSDGFIYLITVKRISTYGVWSYINSFKKRSEATGWIQSDTIPESTTTNPDYSPLTGAGFFRNDTLYWFGGTNQKPVLISQNVLNSEKRTTSLETVSPGAVLPTISPGTPRIPLLDYSDIREVGGVYFLLEGSRLYQVDLNISRAAERMLFPLGPDEFSKGFIVGCDGRLYVFLKPVSDGTAWRGYSASISSLRNVFIQN